MRKLIIIPIFLLFVVLSGIHAFAGKVMQNKAKQIGLNLYIERYPGALKTASIENVIEEKENGETVFYIIIYSGKGFALISAEDAIKPILGYSFESAWKEKDRAPAFEFYIIKRLRKLIYAVKQAGKVQDAGTQAIWEYYSRPVENFQPQNADSFVPLLKTLWNQDSLYNFLCPADPAGPDGHAYVGCVATSMAQVLNYWQHPWHGTGSHSYTPDSHPEYGVQSADFSSAIYNFDNMPDTVTTYSYDLAELMYHCAVSVNMDFGPDGSGASGWGNNDVSYALQTWFYFNEAVNDLNRSSYPGSLWPDLLKADLDLNRPVIYGATDNQQDVGHSWVIDAYTTGDMFHCNWGWGGWGNGWFSIDNFSVNGNTFDTYEAACVHIYPKTSHISGTWNLSGSPYNLNYDHYVDPGEQLIIEPGVRINFTGRYKLEVSGRIVAQGTESDSIVFTSNLPEIGMRGIGLVNTNEYSADSSILQYCRFEYGKGKITSPFSPEISYGGSIYCENSSRVSVSNSLISESIAYYGGGIACLDSSNIRITNCIFEKDTAGAHGGGIYLSQSNAVLSRNLFQNNKCLYSNGGGIYFYYSNASLSLDTIRNNNSQFGGGIGIHQSDIDFEEVVIYGNSANVDGGGIYMAESDSHLNKVHLFNNTAGGSGGAILCCMSSGPQVERTLINSNYASAGAALAIYSSNPVLSHVTIANNGMDPDGEAVFVENGNFNIMNSIIWNNFDEDIDTSGSCIIIPVYSIIQSGPWTGTGVLKKDPLFVHPELSDFHLRWDGYPLPDENKSPAIDGGDPASPFDPDGTRTDMGIYPYEQTFTSLAGGNISGTLTCSGSPYFVTGNLLVPLAEQLIIEPCVSLIFMGDYRLEVRGRILAEGSEGSRINFACSDTLTGWQGIRFINTNSNGQDSSYLSHCRITFGNANGSVEYEKGGALYFSSSKNVRVDHCLINKNKATSQGGAVYISSTYGPQFTANRFENNAAPYGGALYGIYTTMNLRDNIIQNNKATDGGGICVHTSNIYSSGNLIRNNRAEEFGGGIYIVEHGTCSFDPLNKSSIYLNYAAAAGLDLFFTGNANYVKQIVLDTFSVQTLNEHYVFPMQNFNVSKNHGVIEQVNSDLYISMTGSDDNAGTSPESPLKTMYMACMKILADAANPHTIHLAAGTYSEGATGENFPVNWRDYVSLKGAGIYETIIYGEEKNQLLYCYHDDGFTIDSLTFQGGYSQYGGAIRLENHSSPYITQVHIKENFAQRHGGGLYCKDYSSPHIYDIKVYDNTVNEHGGGIMLYNYCDATIVNSMIYDNFALYNGGGICTQFYSDVYFDSLTVYNNTAVQGAGLNFNWVCAGSVNNSLIQQNDALTHVGGYSGTGGGAWIYYYSSPAFNNVTFRQNHADAIGGGIYASSQTYSVFRNCLIEYNTSNSGAGLYLSSTNHRYINSVISNNSTINGSGGAIYATGGSPYFNNVTITQNSVNGYGTGGALYCYNATPQFNNCILWDNSPGEISIGSGSVLANYCNIEGSYPGTGNINADPLFDWTINGQFDLDELSPCIDAGNPDTTGLLLPLFDFAGNIRIVNDTIDMGAHEFQSFSGIQLELKAFLQGPFNGTTMNATLNSGNYLPLSQPYNQAPWNYSGTESVLSIPNAGVVDWILVELRDALDAASAGSSTIVARQAGFILNDGTVTGIDGFSPMSFNYAPVNFLFAVNYHRNSIPVMSSGPLSSSGKSNYFCWNFTTGGEQAFGGTLGHKELAPGLWGMTAGDGNADNQVNNSDKNNIWTPQSGSSGYLSGDFNLDGQVNNVDKNNVWKPNTGSGGQVPQ